MLPQIRRMGRCRWLRVLAVGALLLALAIPARGQDRHDTEPSFFDPLVTLAPGISRELDLLFRRLGFDPASASAPFVATLVDVTGLVIYFGVAYLILRGTLL